MNGITIIRFINGSKRYKIEGDLWQFDYGQKLIIEGLDLPGTYEVHFSNKEIYGSTKTQIGTADGVTIPDEYLISGEPLFVFIFLHDGTDDGETEYKAKIYVKRRPEPSDVEPTPQEQSAITEALAAFNKATDDIRNMEVESETLEPGSEATATWDGEKLTIGIPRGDIGPKGTTITNIALNADYTLAITTSDGKTFTTPPIRGEKGEPGDDYILTPSDKAEIAELVDIIDDTAGAGDTDKTWSADKISYKFDKFDLSDRLAKGTGEKAIREGVLSGTVGTRASGNYSHAEGIGTNASGVSSHAEGNGTVASGNNSHAMGSFTIANHRAQFVFGEYNKEDESTNESTARGEYIEIVGNGANKARSNARTLDWNGNEVIAGKMTVGLNPVNAMDVSTKEYVDTTIADALGDITGFEFQIVNTLPATGDKGIMYLVAHTHGTNDVYDEYIWVTDKYERLGTLDVDLSNYVTFDDYASVSKAGVVKVKVGDNGLTMTNGYISTYPALSSDIKNGTNSYRQPAVNKQHESTFYGLAKAAGDATQSQSSNAVGTYTEEAKVAIRNMIDATGESASVTVTGTDPVIQAARNTRYICGEILSLDFTPCASGICEVIFTSGSSVTVLTLPETIKMPKWFEVETDHTYEISVVDGVYGAVMVW